MIELKTEWFGARVSKSKATTIREYSVNSGVRPTDLVRLALEEYMTNHPVEPKPVETTTAAIEPETAQ